MQGANNNQWLYAQGKCLGGSSGRNQMLYNRGTRGSYALWAEEVGDDAYLWDNMYPFYEKSVTHNGPDMSTRAANSSFDFSIDAYLNNDGPLQISYPKVS